MCCKYVPGLNNAAPPPDETSDAKTVIKSVGKYVIFAAVLIVTVLILSNLGILA